MTKLTHAGERPGRVSLPLLVSPASDGLQSNTLRPPLVPVACFSLAAPSFDFDSSFLVPAMRDELVGLARMRKRFQGSPLALFAHADPSGDDEYNKKLSGRRARSVFALLVRRPDIWEQLFASGTKGDRWGRRQLDIILSVLSPAPDEPPYLAGVPTDASTSASAVRRFQRDNDLLVDGVAGPVTRKRLFERYMEHLGHGDAAPDADPPPLRVEPEEFLGAGASDANKAAMQGCGEFNLAMVLGASESAAMSKGDRDDENAVNRRVVIYVFDKGTTIDVSKWPCPTVDEGPAGCKKRFWPDGDARRSPRGDRRTFDDSQDTFACRFYQRIAGTSPCERPASAPLTVDILFDVPRSIADLDQVYTLVSTDQKFSQTLTRAASLRLDLVTLTLRFTGVRRGKLYSLFLDVGGAATIAIFSSVPLDAIDDFGTVTKPPDLRAVLLPPKRQPRPPVATRDPLLVEAAADTRDNDALYDKDPAKAGK